jgi:hypothetical protein
LPQRFAVMVFSNSSSIVTLFDVIFRTIWRRMWLWQGCQQPVARKFTINWYASGIVLILIVSFMV